MILRPTHRCFDDALEYLEELARRKDPTILAHKLVHGILHADDGPLAHAWVEFRDEVITAGLLNGRKVYFEVARGEYYDGMRVTDPTYYSVQEACEQNRKHKTYGPWEKRYLDLCAKRGTYTKLHLRTQSREK